MKKSLVILAIPACMLSCKDRKLDKSGQLPGPEKAVIFKDTAVVKMIDSVHDFGKVTEGEKVIFSYRFVNGGKNDLIIDKAEPTCGCTIAEATKDPIKTGDTGYVKIEFNSMGRVGHADKTINVRSNAFEQFPPLKLTGEVLAADK
jgi:hypothetical protein